jgi:hypothetical protein
MRRIVIVALAAACVAGCNLFNKDSTTSPSPTTVPETYNGSVASQGVSIFNFTVGSSGAVTVTLSATSATTPLGLGIGTPTASSCTLTTSTRNATASTSAQISVNESAGAYCVEVFDPGGLTGTATFTVSVAHP